MSEIVIENPDMLSGIRGKGSYWYDDNAISSRDIENHLDKLGGKRWGVKGRVDRPGTYQTGEGLILRPISAWVANSTGNIPVETTFSEKVKLINEIADTVKLHFGGNNLKSPGSVGRDLVMKLTGKYGATLPGWGRHLGRRAVHQGPMLAYVASAPYSILHDRSQAFLHALKAKMPIGWRFVAGACAGDFTEGHLDALGAENALSKCSRVFDSVISRPSMVMPGIIEAEIDVFNKNHVSIPAETQYGPFYARGHVRGVWLLHHFCRELERGNIGIVAVHNLMMANRTEPIYEPVYKAINAIDHKPTRKALYTRIWGSLMAGGSITVTPEKPEETPGVKVFKTIHSKWWVSITEKLPDDYQGAPPLTRPDHAAFIAGDNDCVVREAAWDIIDNGGKIHSILTDSIAHDGKVTLPGWKTETEGVFRQYATGAYWFGGDTATVNAHNGDLKRYRAMGARSTRLEDAEILWSIAIDRGRDWSLNPKDAPMAESEPIWLEKAQWESHFSEGLPD